MYNLKISSPTCIGTRCSTSFLLRLTQLMSYSLISAGTISSMLLRLDLPSKRSISSFLELETSLPKHPQTVITIISDFIPRWTDLDKTRRQNQARKSLSLPPNQHDASWISWNARYSGYFAVI